VLLKSSTIKGALQKLFYRTLAFIIGGGVVILSFGAISQALDDVAKDRTHLWVLD
jgi:hypothetical protein